MLFVTRENPVEMLEKDVSNDIFTTSTSTSLRSAAHCQQILECVIFLYLKSINTFIHVSSDPSLGNWISKNDSSNDSNRSPRVTTNNGGEEEYGKERATGVL
jgi:hypothetical protein